MKTLVLTLFLITTILSNISSQHENFYLENNQVYWQNIFETKLQHDDIIKYFQTNAILENINYLDYSIIGTLMPIETFYEELGYDKLIIPIFIVRRNFTGDVTIDFKDGRYRVTIRNIKGIQKFSDVLTAKDEVTDIEVLIVKKGEFVKWWTSKPEASKILNYTFTKIFTVNISDISDEW